LHGRAIPEGEELFTMKEVRGAAKEGQEEEEKGPACQREAQAAKVEEGICQARNTEEFSGV
jgi:hypothetical protein